MHEPYATWILEQEALTPEQRAALESHLAQCAPCQALDLGWRAARRGLSHYPEAAPRPGYLARWQVYRAAQVRRRRRQAWVAGLLAGAGAILALLLSALLGLSPLTWLVGRLIAGVRWAAQAHALWVLLRALADLLPRPLSALLLAGSSLSGAALVVFWAWLLLQSARPSLARSWRG
ncbi:MAG TPA: zf-HC2 domain-containing protein [Anaerolineae bacterium]|nr:zf-HC2 domain-containing protein [Anaerolineae bacterium]HIQ08095.1 zf-HC2 domain-containing protein [Anaerolineaceae bacterium]